MGASCMPPARPRAPTGALLLLLLGGMFLTLSAGLLLVASAECLSKGPGPATGCPSGVALSYGLFAVAGIGFALVGALSWFPRHRRSLSAATLAALLGLLILVPLPAITLANDLLATYGFAGLALIFAGGLLGILGNLETVGRPAVVVLYPVPYSGPNPDFDRPPVPENGATVGPPAR